MEVYIIKEETSSWDGCSGVSSDETYLNLVFADKDKALKKVEELNKEYGHYGCGSSLHYSLERQNLII